MPWILYRYILAELLKLLAVTTAVLVTVISIAAAVQPMAEGLLGPVAMLKFVAFTAPTMLAFALPFSAAFASTLVYLRLASDNEILACSASGMSYRSILAPVVGLGLALTMTLFLLSNFVLPQFYRAAKETAESDMLTVLVSQLNRNKAFDRFGDVVIYADRAVQHPPPTLPDAEHQPTRWIELMGVAVGQLEDGVQTSDATAERANILLFRDRDHSWVTIRLRDAMYYDPARGQLGYTAQLDLPPFQLPNPMRERPRFFSWPELRRLIRNPEGFKDIRQARDALARAIGTRWLHRSIVDELRAGDGVELLRPSEGDRYRIRGEIADIDDRGAQVVLEAVDGRPVRVDYESTRFAPRRFEARRITITSRHRAPDPQPVAIVMLEDVRVHDARMDGGFTEHARLGLPRLWWPTDLLPGPPEQLHPSDDLMSRMALDPRSQDAPEIARHVRRLADEMVMLARQIDGQLHDRAASAVACLLLMALGAVLSIRMRGQMPLAVYFWSFMLAIMVILLIYAGTRTARNADLPVYVGLGVLWSGNAMLIAIIATTYRRLARN
ncbi:MAG: LptF/LptG family permease [Phycisphaeraceae bacterium]